MAITALDKLINGNDLVAYTDLLKSGLPFASIDQYKGHEYALDNFYDCVKKLNKQMIFVPSGTYTVNLNDSMGYMNSRFFYFANGANLINNSSGYIKADVIEIYQGKFTGPMYFRSYKSKFEIKFICCTFLDLNNMYLLDMHNESHYTFINCEFNLKTGVGFKNCIFENCTFISPDETTVNFNNCTLKNCTYNSGKSIFKFTDCVLESYISNLKEQNIISNNTVTTQCNNTSFKVDGFFFSCGTKDFKEQHYLPLNFYNGEYGLPIKLQFWKESNPDEKIDGSSYLINNTSNYILDSTHDKRLQIASLVLPKKIVSTINNENYIGMGCFSIRNGTIIKNGASSSTTTKSILEIKPKDIENFVPEVDDYIFKFYTELLLSNEYIKSDDSIVNKKYVDDIASKKANSTEVTTSIKTAIDNLRTELMGEGVPEAYDTFKELADYIERHQTVADALVAAIGNKVDKIEGKGLSTNDFTTEDKNKLEGIVAGAQVNIIESISVNGVVQTIVNKSINITVPTGALADKSKVSESDLDIDLKNKLSGYAKKTDLDVYITETEVDTKLENYLPKSGGTLTGALTLKGAPTADLQAATKKYVDDKAPLIIDASSITSMETTNAALNSIGTASKMKREVLLISGTNVYHLNYATDDEVAFVCIDSKKIYTATLCSGDEAVSYDTCYVSATQRTVTLSSTRWTASGDVYTQTATVSGVSATETTQEIHVTPATASMTAYMESVVYASAQASNRITFTASEKPTADLTVYVVIRTL